MPYPTALFNATNISSKNEVINQKYIFEQKQGNRIYGYKVQYSIGGKPEYKNFGRREYSNLESVLEAAKEFRDEQYAIITSKISELEKKSRDIEFERGLRRKIKHCEKDEILDILKKYSISTVE
ncbi:MAG: hypothetical protein LLF96_02005 [Eubacteriales bacterium]|nr:hypothetical protein [Eubacteriales bacterium]